MAEAIEAVPGLPTDDLGRPVPRQRRLGELQALQADHGRGLPDRAVHGGGGPGRPSLAAGSVRSRAARADEQPPAADLGRGGADALHARHRRAGPRHLLGHSLRPADLACRRLPRGRLLGDPRHRARPDRRLCRRQRRCGHHAHRRRAADLPGDPDRASRRRRGQVRARRPARRRRRRSPCSSSRSA